MHEQLEQALAAAKIEIKRYSPDKAKSIRTNVGTLDAKGLAKKLQEKLGGSFVKYPEVFESTHNLHDLEEMVASHAASKGRAVVSDGEIVIPPDLQDYTLNVDRTAKTPDGEFFLTTPDEYVSETSGRYYISRCKIPPPVTYDIARPVIPEYQPRRGAGVFTRVNSITKETENVFNKYTPPDWLRWKNKNPKAWRALPESCPPLVMKMLQHLFPLKEERKYLYGWIYASVFTRSYVYLVLSGAPGAGKNRLKLLMRALHGKSNAIDGKKSTLTEKFNSQLAKGTLAWFDELKYDADMENVMKEFQNDYVAIEAKGIDASTTSTIYTSMVISNNKPRDNYIAFDARKFAPLVLASLDLKNSMTMDEIDTLSRKLDVGGPDFDVKYVAQIAKWLMKTGKRWYEKDKTLEYKGPMFWILAHTSMAKWQKKAAIAAMETKRAPSSGWDSNVGGFLWSKLQGLIERKSENKNIVFPDYSSAQAFFEVFRDGNGDKVFDTLQVTGTNIMNDFYVIPLMEGVEIITEASVAKQRQEGKKNAEETEKYAEV